MILSFKKEINGKPTFFVEKILACISEYYKKHYTPKKHTIRKDNRFKTGDKLHLATGVRTKRYNQFNKLVDGLEKVISTQFIQIVWKKQYWYAVVWVDFRELSTAEIETLAKNDGFDSVQEFFEWFNKDFEGQIIHWTDLQY